MKFGDIILIPFPFAELAAKKVRPVVVIVETCDKYKDIVVSAISSIIPADILKREVLVKANKINNLRVDSIIKADRIVTLKREDVIANLGKLSPEELLEFRHVLLGMIN